MPLFSLVPVWRQSTSAMRTIWNLLERMLFTTATILLKSASRSVKAIGTNAFFDCHALKNVTISTSSKMKTIGTAAFAYCSMLKSITIPAGVKEIAEKTFIADINLETITFAAE